MTTPNTLRDKMFAIMSAIDAIPKDGYNDFHKYAYATERAIKEVVRAQLLQQKVLFQFEVTDVTTQETKNDKGDTSILTVIRGNAVFICVESGEEMRIPFAGQGADKGDKGIYKAITGAIKYALTSTFLIPTGDDAEADTSIDKHYSRPTKTTPKPLTVEQTAQMFSVDQSTGEILGGAKACKVCGGAMNYKEGVSKTGKAWKAWMCESKIQDHTEWVR